MNDLRAVIQHHYRMLRWSWVVGLNVVIFSLMGYAQEKTPEIELKINQIKVLKKEHQDSIEISGVSNLPPGTLLEFGLSVKIFCLAAPDQEQNMVRKILKVDTQRRFQAVSPELPFELPPAIYTVKLGVSQRQRAPIKQALPPQVLGKIVAQQDVVIGDLKDLINDGQEELKETDNTIAFFNIIYEGLCGWVDVYNSLKDKQDFMKNYLDKFTAWQKGVEMPAKLVQIIQRVKRHLPPGIPGIYRLTNLKALDLGLDLNTVNGVLAFAAHGITSLSKVFPGHGLKEGEPGKTQLPGSMSKPKEKPNILKGLLIKDTIFSILLIMHYYSAEVTLTYEGLPGKTDPREFWDQKNAVWQSALSELDKYSTDFQKQFSDDKTTPLEARILRDHKPGLDLVTEYRLLLNKVIEGYTKLISGELKPDEIEVLKQSIHDARVRMDEIFPQTKTILEH